VLGGLCKLNDKLMHPVIGESMSVLAERLRGADFTVDAEQPQLIAIAGNIGVGKSMLAGKLSLSLNCPAVLEAYDDNPFLADVYAGNKDLSLDSQLFFLTSRLDQLGPGTLGVGNIAVCDYVFEKELIYARQLLDERQFNLYEKIFEPLRAKVARPVLVIFLYDRPGNCLERIHRRNRSYEQAIELDFLSELDLQYVRLFDDWKACPVIRLDMSSFDCMRNGDITKLKTQIISYVAGPWK
jgi:deoxyadenosine/deoxycytidine kinase